MCWSGEASAVLATVGFSATVYLAKKGESKELWMPLGILVAFIMPVIYGSWRFIALHVVMGPVVSTLTTNDPNEFIAVWCLYSIALCLAVIKSPIRRYLHVRSWPAFAASTT